MLYFAYGSNLSSRRLQRRVPSARLVTTGQLMQHRLLFHKIGRDGSAKCNAFFTGRTEDVLYGGIFMINPSHRVNLDRAEGLGRGYEIKHTRVAVDDARQFEVFTYFATQIAADILPFHWYKKHVLAGAQELDFPQHYIDNIATVPVVEDHDLQRTENELAIYGPQD